MNAKIEIIKKIVKVLIFLDLGTLKFNFAFKTKLKKTPSKNPPITFREKDNGKKRIYFINKTSSKIEKNPMII